MHSLDSNLESSKYTQNRHVAQNLIRCQLLLQKFLISLMISMSLDMFIFSLDFYNIFLLFLPAMTIHFDLSKFCIN